MEPYELKLLVDETKRAWQALGKINYKVSKVEEKSKKFRRSLYFVKDMKAGEIITEDCVRCVRPGYGLEPKCWDNIMGCSLCSFYIYDRDYNNFIICLWTKSY